MVDSIYVTLGRDQLKEKPYREQIKDFLICDGDKYIFSWIMSQKPTKDFIWVYIVIGNRVRWRARFIGWAENKTYELLDGRIIKGNYIAQLIDFEKLPRQYEVKKGFQGFRYKY